MPGVCVGAQCGYCECIVWMSKISALSLSKPLSLLPLLSTAPVLGKDLSSPFKEALSCLLPLPNTSTVLNCLGMGNDFAYK